MKTMFKRLLSLTLCILMLAAMLPTNFALAQDVGPFSISGGGALRVGGSLQLRANGVGAEDTIVWSSDDTGIATVDQSGLVSGVALGETQIQAVRTYRDANDEVQVETRKATVTVVTYYSVTFVIPDIYSYGEGIPAPVPPQQQVIKDTTANRPETPAIPEGYRYFVAWNLDGNPYNFETPVTGDITLVAEFSDNCLVSFENADGSIMHSIPVPVGQTLLDPHLDVVPPADRSFTGEWKIRDTDDKTFVFGVTHVTENLRLVPQFINTYYVFFNSNGSSVAPRLVGAYQTITDPPIGVNAPTRAGYTFVHWYLDNENTPFNFATTQITSTTVLTAKWTPKSVTYQIAHWIEKPGVSGDPGDNPSNYMFVATTNHTALAGSTVAATDVIGGSAIYANSNDVLSLNSATTSNRVGTFRHGSTSVISGTGTTIINAYYKRVSFTITFNLGTGGTMIKDGQTYTGSQYSLTAKYGSSIEAAWPSSANASISRGTGANDKFTSWTPSAMRTTSGFASKRYLMDYSMLPNKTTVTTATVTANYGNVSTRQLNYWLEALPGQSGGVTKTFGSGINAVTATFVLSAAHSQRIDSGTLVAKILTGYTNVGSEDTNEDGMFTHNFYYIRIRYTLSFDTQVSGLTVPDVPNLPHSIALADYRPADPEAPGKTFLGWYYESDHRTLVDWETAVLPTGDLRLFAAWESDEFTAKFFMDDTLKKLVHSAGVEGGHAIAAPNLFSIGQAYDVNGNIYDPEAGVDLQGVFKGWYWFLPGSYNREKAAYSFETLISENITLFGRWETGGFKVSYSWGSRTPNNNQAPPVDNNTYAYGAGATLISPPNQPLSSSNMFFAGWQINGTGPMYYQGNVIRIYGDTNVTAYWHRTNDVVALTFDKNCASEPGTIVWPTVPKNTTIALPGAGFFTRSDGYALIGWNTNAAGTGTSYDLGGSFIPTQSTQTLYAMWTPAKFQVTYSAGSATDDPSLRDMPESPVSQLLGGQVQVPSQAPSRFGMVFQGWRTNDLGTNNQILPAGTVFTMPGRNVTLTAIWKAKEFTVTFQDGFDGTEDVQHGTTLISRSSVPYGDSARLITNLPQHEHWLFDRWVVVNEDGSESALYETMLLYITANLTLRAKWKPAPKYNVSYVDEDGTTVLQAPIAQSQGAPIPSYEGETPTKADLNGVRYTFNKWLLAEGVPGPGDTVGTTDLVYKASYTSVFIPYTVTYAWDGSAVPAGQTLPAQLTGKNVNNPITIAPSPTAAGWTFNGWYTKAGSPVTVVAGDKTFIMPAGDVRLYGAWTAIDYTITYKNWDGTILQGPDTVHIGDDVIPYASTRPTPTKPDENGVRYTFSAWTLVEGTLLGGKVGTTNLVYQASFGDALIDYEVKYAWAPYYELPDGVVLPDSLSGKHVGDPITVAPDPTIDRWTFYGWYTMDGALVTVGEDDATFTMPAGDVTLYGHWIHNGYYVTHFWDSATVPASAVLPERVLLRPGDYWHTPEIQTAPGWTMSDWYLKDDSTVLERGGKFRIYFEDVNLYAAWTPIDYTVSYVDDDGTTVLQAPITVHIGDDVPGYTGVTPTKADNNGVSYTFTGFVLAQGTLGSDGKVYTSSLVYKATYSDTMIDYSVNYAWDGPAAPGAVLPNSLSGKHRGDTIDVAADPVVTGWTFNGWYTKTGSPVVVGANDPRFTMPAGNVTLYGAWTAIDYTITYKNWDGTILQGPDIVHIGDTVIPYASTLPTPTKPDNNGVRYTFTNWALVEGTLLGGKVGTTDLVYQAVFGDALINYTVNFYWDTLAPDAAGNPPLPMTGKNVNNEINLTFPATVTGWTFNGWYTKAGSPVTVLAGAPSFIMPASDVALYGSWTHKEHTVTYAWETGSMVPAGHTVPGQLTGKYYGDAITVADDQSEPGWVFTGWHTAAGAPVTVGDSTVLFKMPDDDVTLYAAWTRIEYSVTYKDWNGTVLYTASPLYIGNNIPAYEGATPTRPDVNGVTYTFNDWTLTSGTPGANKTIGTTSLVYTADYSSTLIEYGVRYAWETGSPLPSNAAALLPTDAGIYYFGDDVEVKADAAAAGWIFTGWHTAAGAPVTVSDSDATFKMPAGNVTLYGRWEKIDYTVTYVDENGTTVLQAAITVNIGDDVPPYTGATPTKADNNGIRYTFAGFVLATGTLGADGKVGSTSLVYKATYSDAMIDYGVNYAWDGNAAPGAVLPPSLSGQHRGDPITIADDPVVTGWTFNGWYTKQGAPVTVGVNDTSFTMPAGDVTLYGAWTQNNYTVSYALESSLAPAGQTLPGQLTNQHYGDPITVAADPSEPGWVFTGWHTATGALVTVGDNDASFTMPDGNVVLYGRWTKIDYAVSYVDEDGTTVLQAAIIANIGDAIPAYNGLTPTKPDANGITYTFAGWALMEGIEGPGKTMGTTNLVYKATYGDAMIDYSVGYAWDGTAAPGAVLPSSLSQKHIGDPITVAADPVVTGWTFNGWYTKAGSPVTVGKDDASFTMPAGDVTLYGAWTQNNYTVDYAWATGSLVPAGQTLPGQLTNRHYGDPITVAVDPSEPGWIFTGWYTLAGALVTVGQNQTSFTMPDGNVTLYGDWKKIDYTVTYVNFDDTVLQAAITVNIGDPIPGYQGQDPTRPDNNGVSYTFSGWALTGTEGPNKTVGTTNLEYKATYASSMIDYTVGYAWESGSPLPSDAAQLLPASQPNKHRGDPITVAADPSSTGWTFIGWHTEAGALVTVGDNQGSFTMPAGDVMLYGRWTQNEYTVSYAWQNGSPVPQGQTLPTGLTGQHYRDTITVAADLSEAGWVFTGWHTVGAAAVTVGDDDATFTMPASNVVLYGRWEKLYTITYVNYDDTVLQAAIEKLAGEEIPAYTGQTPTRPDNNGTRYTFANTWTLVSGTTGGNNKVGTTNLVFKANYTSNLIDYSVYYAWDGAAAPGAVLPDALTGKNVNNPIGVAADPVVTGWTFDGWYTKAGAPVVVVSNQPTFTMPASDVTLYGAWTQNEHVVNYAWDGTAPAGKTLPSQLTNRHYGDPITVAADPSEPGWTFDGWYTKAGALVTVGSNDRTFTMPDGNVTLYGKWTMIDYTVTYVNYDDAVLQGPTTVHVGDPITAYSHYTPTKPDNNGVSYTFDKFVLASGTEGANGTVGTTSLVYKATYGEAFIDYAVRYAWDGAAPAGAVLPGTVTDHHVNDLITVANKATMTGWTFNGWYTKDGSAVTVLTSTRTFKMPAADVVLYGAWTQNEYAVSYAFDGTVPAGAATLLPAQRTGIHYEDNVIIAADPVLAGYDFDGWYTKAGALVTVAASDTNFAMPNGNVTLYGRWVQKNHTVTYTWDGTEPAGAVLPANLTNRHYNDPITISMPRAVSGWLFLGWRSLPGATPVIVAGDTSFRMPDGNVTLVGSWEKLYNVNYAWDRDNGAMVPSTAKLPAASLNQRAGTTINVAAKPAISGWLFEGWYTKDAGGGKVPLNVANFSLGTADVVIYGMWTRIGTLTVTPYDKPYDGAAHGVGVVGEKGDTIYYSLDNTTWTTTPELRTNVQSAETIFIRAEQAGYTTRTATATISITPRVLNYSITAPKTVIYGDGATVGYTLTGFASGENLGNLPGLTETALQPVSPIDGLTPADANTPHQVIIPTAVAMSGGVMQRYGNYAINPTGAAITVMPRPITLAGDSFTKYVGADEPIYTYSVIGTMVNGDTITADLVRTNTKGDPGDYTIHINNVLINGTDAALNGNYVVTLKPGKLLINALPTFTLTFIVRGGPYGSTGLTVYTRELIQGLIIPVPNYNVPSGYTFSGFANVPEKMPPHAVTIYGELSGGPATRELEETEIEWIEDNTIPLAAPNYRAWSLVNLIIAMLTALGAVLLMLGYIGKKRREANPAKGIQAATINKKGGWRLASLLPGIGAIVAFLLTENMTDPVVLLDSWTPLMVVIALIQVGVAILAGRKVTEIEPEQADVEA